MGRLGSGDKEGDKEGDEEGDGDAGQEGHQGEGQGSEGGGQYHKVVWMELDLLFSRELEHT